MIVTCPTDSESWPTLGPQVVGFIREYLVHGPGDLRGEPVQMDQETEALIYKMYEVYPAGHAQAGRRRFKRVGLSRRKGTAKTELAAWIAAVELHPEGPVRCDGFDAAGDPVGRGVRDPYIAMVAYTEEQSDELAYAALYVVLSEGPLADSFDIGIQRITRADGSGRAVSLSAAPDARDGARTTFQVFDETHRMNLPRLVEAHGTMLANAGKRKLADPWTLETTTAFVPGEGSVAERTWHYAHQVMDGEIEDPKLFFFHRQASDDSDLTTPEGLRAAIVEASGPTAEWSDLEAIAGQWTDPSTDKNYLERVWLNRPRQASSQAFDVLRWEELAKPDYVIGPQAWVVLGFDGSFIQDSTALIGCEVETGHLFVVGIWERPQRTRADWTVDRGAVDEAVRDAFHRLNVLYFYADPHYWESNIAEWKGAFGDARVQEFDTRSKRNFSYGLRNFATAIEVGDISHDGNPILQAHIGNARRVDSKLQLAVDGQPLWTIRKERPDSPLKIDAAVASVLAWEARQAATINGLGRSAYEGQLCRCGKGPRRGDGTPLVPHIWKPATCPPRQAA